MSMVIYCDTSTVYVYNGVQREFEFYGDVSNCSTALENRYNRDITRLRSVYIHCTYIIYMYMYMYIHV